MVFAAVLIVCGACMSIVANDWNGARRGLVVILMGTLIALIVILLSPYDAFGSGF